MRRNSSAERRILCQEEEAEVPLEEAAVWAVEAHLAVEDQWAEECQEVLLEEAARWAEEDPDAARAVLWEVPECHHRHHREEADAV